MERTPVNLIILVTGFIGFLQGVQRFLIGYALVYYDWDLTEFGLVHIFSALAMSIPRKTEISISKTITKII